MPYANEDKQQGSENPIYCRLIVRNLPERDAASIGAANGAKPTATEEVLPGEEQLDHGNSTHLESDNETYEAVSWTWGSQQDSASIYIEDNGVFLPFEVRSNLIAVLKHLRRKEAMRNLWVDAVCIHQKHEYEKNLQVAMMAHIYGNAERVCIWLGEHQDKSELALEFIHKTVSDLGAFEEITTSSEFSEQWTALGALMNRPWFSRRWVVQEISHAKNATIHCGDNWVYWSDFETAVSLFERDAARIAKIFHGSRKADYDPNFFGDVEAMGATRLVQAKSKLFRRDDDNQIAEYRYPLSDLVTELSSFEAGNPHDMIYAVLSLAKDTHHRTQPRDNSQADRSEPISREQLTGANAHKRTSDEMDCQTMPGSMAEDDHLSKKRRRDSGAPSSYTAKETILAKMTLGAMQRKVAAKPEHPVFQVDYKQEFFKVCKQFLDFSLRYPTGRNNLDILCKPWAPMLPRSQLPSWVPSAANAAFEMRPAPYAPGGKQISRKNHDPLVCSSSANSNSTAYNSCRGQKAREWRFGNEAMGENKFGLFVWGFVIDKIGEIETYSLFGNIPEEWFHLAGWYPWDDHGRRVPQSPPPERLWRTLVADRGPDGANAKVYYAKAFEYAIDNSTPTTGLETTNLAKRSNPILVEFLKRMMAVVWNRRLFKTADRGLLGLAPKKARENDGKHDS